MPLVFIVGICLSFLTAGIGLTLSILYIRYDDMRNIVNVLLMILMYFTPILYPLSVLSPRLQKIIQLNPLTSYLDVFRWAFSNNASATLSDWIFMITTSLLSISIGTLVFKKFWPRTVAML
jgi:ABC-type polysaccharide/polyol phosphate export permease